MILLQARHHFEGVRRIPWTADMTTSSSAAIHKRTLDSTFRLIELSGFINNGYLARVSLDKIIKILLQSTTALLSLDCRNGVLGLVGEADACGVSPCPFAAPDLPVRSLNLHCQGVPESSLQLTGSGRSEVRD